MKNNIYIIRQEPLIKNTIYNIVFYLIDACNYKCSYCYNKFPRSGLSLNYSTILTFIKYIQTIIKLPIKVTFIGGEATLHSKFLEIINFLNNINIQSEFLTNLSAPIETYITALQLNAILIASWHGLCNKRNDEFINKIMMIPKKYFDANQIDIRIMLEPDNWENSINAVNQLCGVSKKDIEISLLIQPNGNFYKYTNKQLSEFKQLNKVLEQTVGRNKEMFKLFFSNKTYTITSFNDLYMSNIDFYLWKCDAGLKNIYIHADGNAYPCQSYYEHHRKPLFNICDHEIKYKVQPTICNVDYCSCEFNLKKEKLINYERKHACL